MVNIVIYPDRRRIKIGQDRDHNFRLQILKYFLTMIIGLSIVNCGGLQRNPVPVEQMADAVVAGLPKVRSWGGEFSPHFQEDIIQSVRDEPVGKFPRHPDGTLAYNVLALSGGGSDGAFGAGILCGWTDSGLRPNFKLVTGISTGALIAPFAFLGPEYDGVLRKFYTGVSTAEILQFKGPLAALGGEALTDPVPLVSLIAKLVDEDFLKAIAEAHARGKRLLIGTTNLDADRLMAWNMGAIAASKHPNALGLFRDVMLASASIPGVFPPVYIQVEVDGQLYDEMHVDGGVKNQVFFYKAMLKIADAVKAISSDVYLEDRSSVYVVRNGKLEPEPEQVRRKTLAIAGRAVSSMIKTSAASDLFRIYMFAQRDGFNFYHTGLPLDIKFESSELFDRATMNQMFEIGYQMAVSGKAWQTRLPGLE
jgi:predicted acylesterase/phospholipase RssA